MPPFTFFLAVIADMAELVYIVGADLVANRIVDPPFKYDTGCLGNEKPEDALT
jgi:hypothetical protein